MRHNDLLFFLDALGTFARAADFAGATHQLLDDTFDHLNHVRLALAQVWIVKRIELFHERVHLLYERPFGIAAARTNQRLRPINQFRVLQDQRMHINKGAHFRGRLGHFTA